MRVVARAGSSRLRAHRSPTARWRSATTARCSRSGGRAEIRAEFSEAPEERAEGVLLPGLVNAHSHLELSGHVDGVPGGKGLFAWATALMGAARPTRQRSARHGRGGRDRAPSPSAPRPLATSATRSRPPRDRPGGPRGVLFHELFGSREIATGDALADAARERAEAAAEWPARLGYVPAPHAPYSVGPELLAAHLRGRGRRPTRDLDPRGRGRRRARAAARRFGRWPALLAGMGVDPCNARAGQVAGRLPGVAGRVPDRDAAAAGPHGPRRRGRSAARPRGRRDRGALPALEPAHRRPPARRRRAASPKGCRSRSAPTASPRSPICRCGPRWRRSPRISRRPGGALAGRGHARRRAGARACAARHAAPGAPPGVLDVLVDDGARRWNRWCAIRTRRCAGWRGHDRTAADESGREVRPDDQVRAHAVRAAVRARRRRDRGARSRHHDRARRRHRRRDGGRPHRGDGLQPDRRPPHRRARTRAPPAASCRAARSRCAPPGR